MTFYKYTTISTAKLVIENQKIRWSSPVVFNDIEECQFTPFTSRQIAVAFEQYSELLAKCASGDLPPNYDSYSDLNKQTVALMKILNARDPSAANSHNEMLKTIAASFESDYRNLINVALVKCFRVLSVTTEFDNNLMWAHYAEQHHGCVLEFDKPYKTELRSLREGFVRYHENLEPESNPLEILLFGETKEITEKLIKDVIFSK